MKSGSETLSFYLQGNVPVAVSLIPGPHHSSGLLSPIIPGDPSSLVCKSLLPFLILMGTRHSVGESSNKVSINRTLPPPVKSPTPVKPTSFYPMLWTAQDTANKAVTNPLTPLGHGEMTKILISWPEGAFGSIYSDLPA